MAIDQNILIFSEESSPRLTYVMDLVVKSLWGLQWERTDDFQFFEASSIGFINYSDQKSSQGIQIIPNELLFQNSIEEQKIEIVDDLPQFFNGDIFASIFYEVSRYEEYLPFKADQHGRFSAGVSLANIHGFLKRPMVQIWAQHLQGKLSEKYPFIKFRKPVFKVQPSYDIDIAWAYEHKGIKRQIGGFVRDLLGKGSSLKTRIGVLKGKQKDPFDTFDYLDLLNSKHKIPAKYFILIGDHGPFDKNISHQNLNFRQLIQGLSDKYQLGIHPSYRSNADFDQLEKEKLRLESLTSQPVSSSRQHYLKLSFPETYQRLIKSGIKEDYSMGYQDALGFRAGIAVPFYWYDLSLEKQTNLLIHPFQIMDVTMKQYLKLDINEAIRQITDIKNEIEGVGGDLVYIWHNSSFHPDEGWDGWSKVLEIFQKF